MQYLSPHEFSRSRCTCEQKFATKVLFSKTSKKDDTQESLTKQTMQFAYRQETEISLIQGDRISLIARLNPKGEKASDWKGIKYYADFSTI